MLSVVSWGSWLGGAQRTEGQDLTCGLKEDVMEEVLQGPGLEGCAGFQMAKQDGKALQEEGIVWQRAWSWGSFGSKAGP